MHSKPIPKTSAPAKKTSTSKAPGTKPIQPPVAPASPSARPPWSAIAPDLVPAVPADYVSIPIEQRRSQLRFLDADLKAEALLAFEEVATRGAAVQQDLGPNVADTAPLADLLRQIRQNDQSLQAARALVAYLTEREQFLESDALRLLDDVAEEVEHLAKKKPALLRAYPHTMAFYEAKGRKIAQGRERAKGKKQDATPA